MKKTVDIIILLDRSGSMRSIKTETINGYNNFLMKQQRLKCKTVLTLAQFDDKYQIDYEAVDLSKIENLNEDTYLPRGLTALLDAIGKTIKLTKKRYKLVEKANIPEKTIFVIITDGQENNSTKYTRDKIFKKIRKEENKNGWEFVFFGANQDAIKEASNYGIKAKRAMTFAADALGTEDVFFALSSNIGESIVNESEFEFTNEQRKKQKR